MNAIAFNKLGPLRYRNGNDQIGGRNKNWLESHCLLRGTLGRLLPITCFQRVAAHHGYAPYVSEIVSRIVAIPLYPMTAKSIEYAGNSLKRPGKLDRTEGF